MDSEDQEEEIESLGAIFGPDLITARGSDNTWEIELSIHIQTPGKIRVLLNMPPTASALEEGPSQKPDFAALAPVPTKSHVPVTPSCIPGAVVPPPPSPELESFVVHQLPPCILSCSFPSAYPSKSPPSFTLECAWASPASLSLLANRLDHLWREGEVVVFRWVEFMKETAWEILTGDSGALLLIPGTKSPFVKQDAVTFPVDSRVRAPFDPTNDSEAMYRAAEAIIAFDSDQQWQKFHNEMQTCGVCFESDMPGSQFAVLPGCQHYFCYGCLSEMCEMNVKEGSVKELKCPDPQCRQQLLPSLLREVLSPDSYIRYERLSFQQSLEAMEDVMFCPRQSCQQPVVIDQALNHGQCAACLLSFCTLCSWPFHPGQACPDAAGILQDLEQRQRQRRGAGQAQGAEDAELARLIARMRAEVECVAVMGKVTRKCPACKVLVEKTGGCNKMSCRCGAFFCWVCGVRIQGYGHFSSASACALFPG